MKTFKDTKYGDLTSQIYKGNIHIEKQKLDSLEGAPSKVEGHFNAMSNKLKSLKYAPTIVQGDFDVDNNLFKDLQGAPKEIHGYFSCSDNPNLESFKGLPNEVGRFFSCYNCPKLKSLKYIPKITPYSLLHCGKTGIDKWELLWVPNLDEIIVTSNFSEEEIQKVIDFHKNLPKEVYKSPKKMEMIIKIQKKMDK
jgi:hypothetical protein